jgi:hypothetical protein
MCTGFNFIYTGNIKQQYSLKSGLFRINTTRFISFVAYTQVAGSIGAAVQAG